MRNFISIAAASACIFCVSSANAADQKEPRPALLQKLIDCRTVSDPTQRLACYDAQVAAIDTAESNRELVVVDKEQIKQTRKSLFGFGDIRLPFFGKKADATESEEDGVDFIESKIASLRSLSDGKWLFVLEDGARWSQTEPARSRSPKVGETIKIRKAALGSYLANVNGRPAIRVKREN